MSKIVTLIITAHLVLAAGLAFAGNATDYSPYLGNWIIYEEEQSGPDPATIAFFEEDDGLLGKPGDPESPVLHLRFEGDGVLKGETSGSDVWPVILERIGSGGEKLLLTYGPPESEYTYVLLIKAD